MPVRPSLCQFLLAGLLAVRLTSVAGAAEPVPEYELKAAFLYNFTLFTEWPDKSDAVLSLCLYGKDSLGKAADQLEGKSVKGAAVKIRRPDSLTQLRACQVLFIGASEQPQLASILEAVKGAPVLTVADTAGAARAGVMINLVLEGQRVTFDINTAAVRAAGLSVSSKLLRLARAVY
jgi:hypothetical protein